MGENGADLICWVPEALKALHLAARRGQAEAQ